MSDESAYGALLARALQAQRETAQRDRDAAAAARAARHRAVVEQGGEFLDTVAGEIRDVVLAFNRAMGREALMVLGDEEIAVHAVRDPDRRSLSIVPDLRLDDGVEPNLMIILRGGPLVDEWHPFAFAVEDGRLCAARAGALLSAQGVARFAIERFLQRLPIH
jgi:hypothetical protein